MTAKKATIVGIQPAQAPAARPPGMPLNPDQRPPSIPRPPASDPAPVNHTPPDGMKTIARPAPGFLNPKQPGALRGPPAKPTAPLTPLTRGGPPSGGLPRPAPGLPSKLAPPRGGPPSGGGAGPTSVSPFSTKPAPKPAPAPSRQALPIAPPAPAPAQTSGLDSADEIDVDLDDGAAQATSNAIEISDDGMADAEAALEAMRSFRLAEAALQRNDMSGAEQLAQKAVEGDPTQADYITLLAWIRSLGGSSHAMAEAIVTMSSVLNDDPNNERALLYRGKLLARSNRLPEALADFNELLAGNPQNRDAQAELRQLKSKIG